MAVAPVLETARLILEPFSEQHLTERYVAWLNDREVVRYSEQRHRPHTLESCRAFMNSFRESASFFWAIVARDDRLGHFGNITAHVDLANSLAELGILIGERHAWGNGFGREAWVAVCGFLLNTAGVRKVSAGTLSANESMLRVMKAAGMVEDGRQLRHYVLDGVEADMVHMALFRTP
jgi:RimJ/RimL family protein N-acetyltransferase